MTGRDRRLLDRAVALAALCPPSDGAFSVGCVLARPDGAVLATGYSRELGPGWHAEETAIHKAHRAGLGLSGCLLYASLEPCSTRLSGKPSCTHHILQTGLARVVFCLEEPGTFVDGRGVEMLRAAGIAVVQDTGPGAGVRAANAHLPWPMP